METQSGKSYVEYSVPFPMTQKYKKWRNMSVIINDEVTRFLRHVLNHSAGWHLATNDCHCISPCGPMTTWVFSHIDRPCCKNVVVTGQVHRQCRHFVNSNFIDSGLYKMSSICVLINLNSSRTSFKPCLIRYTAAVHFIGTVSFH